MRSVRLKLVTIIAEAILEPHLVREIRELGARGHSITKAHGEGSRGVRASEWEGGNVKIETIVSDEVAERIVDHVAQQYFQHYAVITYITEVAVVRGEKYV